MFQQRERQRWALSASYVALAGVIVCPHGSFCVELELAFCVALHSDVALHFGLLIVRV